MRWLNEPASWQRTGGVLTVSVDPGTDFWRQTGYGYIRDSGHVYGDVLAGDLDVSVRIRGTLETQYDQAGVMLRADEATWVKTGVEFFEGQPRLSTVLTLGRSSWTVTSLPEDADEIVLQVVRREDAVEVRYGTGGDEPLELAALVYLPPECKVLAGVMCAAPEGPGFIVSFHDLEITGHGWPADLNAAAASPAANRWAEPEQEPEPGAWAGWPGQAAAAQGWPGEVASVDDRPWDRAAPAPDGPNWLPRPAAGRDGWEPGHGLGTGTAWADPAGPGTATGDERAVTDPGWPAAGVTAAGAASGGAGRDTAAGDTADAPGHDDADAAGRSQAGTDVRDEGDTAGQGQADAPGRDPAGLGEGYAAARDECDAAGQGDADAAGRDEAGTAGGDEAAGEAPLAGDPGRAAGEAPAPGADPAADGGARAGATPVALPEPGNGQPRDTGNAATWGSGAGSGQDAGEAGWQEGSGREADWMRLATSAEARQWIAALASDLTTDWPGPPTAPAGQPAAGSPPTGAAAGLGGAVTAGQEPGGSGSPECAGDDLAASPSFPAGRSGPRVTAAQPLASAPADDPAGTPSAAGPLNGDGWLDPAGSARAPADSPPARADIAAPADGALTSPDIAAPADGALTSPDIAAPADSTPSPALPRRKPDGAGQPPGTLRDVRGGWLNGSLAAAPGDDPTDPHLPVAAGAEPPERRTREPARKAAKPARSEPMDAADEWISLLTTDPDE